MRRVTIIIKIINFNIFDKEKIKSINIQETELEEHFKMPMTQYHVLIKSIDRCNPYQNISDMLLNK